MTQEELVAREAEDRAVMRGLEGRIKALEHQSADLRALVQSVAAIATKQELMSRHMEEIKTDVSDLKAVPIKRWESVVGYLIGALAGGFLTSLFTHFLA